jgi:hypothetical protein
LLLKNKIISLLEVKDYAKLKGLSPSDKKVVSILISLSYDKKSYISWRAIESIGLVTKEIAKSNPEAVRNIAGRLLWMIRDESGGIGWSAPEILGEIVKNNQHLLADIAPVIASFHEEKMLTSGVLWAMGRIGKINTETTEYAIPLITPYIHDSSQVLRGYAAYALGELGASEAVKELEKLKNDNNKIDFYEDGDLKEKTVSEIVVDALRKLLNRI